MDPQRSFYRIVVGGIDVSSAFSPVLQDLSVSLTSGTTSDTASITIDDTDGRVIMPKDGDAITIDLGWQGGVIVEAFRGTVNDVRSQGGRSGRLLTVGCTGMDTKGKAKEPSDKHYDNMTISDILSKAGKAAGISDVRVDGEIGNIKFDFVGQNNESFVALGHRLSVKVGGTFKIMGDRAVMVKRSAGRSATGKPLVTIPAAWGSNLFDWDIKPILGRPRHKETKTRWYDKVKAKWVVEKKNTEDTDAIATNRTRFEVGSETEAKAGVGADADEIGRNSGEGSVTINGDPRAQPEAPCVISGARSGVDGSYLIDSVTHSLSRSGGFVTSLTLKKPGGGAGTDSRGG